MIQRVFRTSVWRRFMSYFSNVGNYFWPTPANQEVQVPAAMPVPPQGSTDEKSTVAVAAEYFSNFGELVRPALHGAINPGQTIAEREQALENNFEVLERGLGAVQNVFEKYGFERSVEQLALFELVTSTNDVPDNFYLEYQQIKRADAKNQVAEEEEFVIVGSDIVSEEDFNQAFLKFSNAFVCFVKGNTKTQGIAECMFQEFKHELEELYVEKGGIYSSTMDNFKGWLKASSSVSSVDITKKMFGRLVELESRWDSQIRSIYEKICRPIEIFDYYKDDFNIEMHSLKYRFKLWTKFEYKDSKKGIRFLIELSNSHVGNQYFFSFVLRRNRTMNVIEILAVDNACEVLEDREFTDNIIYHLIAEILLKELNSHYEVGRLIPRTPSSSSSSSRVNVKRTRSTSSTSSNGNLQRGYLEKYGFDKLHAEKSTILVYDWMLSQDSAREFLADKPRYLDHYPRDII